MFISFDQGIGLGDAIARTARLFWFVCVTVTCVFCVSSAYAENGRDYAATYDFSPSTALDPSRVSVKLFIHLQNHGGGNLANATISLGEHSTRGKDSTLFATGVTASYRGTTNVSGTVTIRIEEYRRWQRGGQPELLIRVTDRNGRQFDRPIELVRQTGMILGAVR